MLLFFQGSQNPAAGWPADRVVGPVGLQSGDRVAIELPAEPGEWYEEIILAHAGIVTGGTGVVVLTSEGNVKDVVPSDVAYREMRWGPTGLQMADVLTKALDFAAHWKHARRLMNLRTDNAPEFAGRRQTSAGAK